MTAAYFKLLPLKTNKYIPLLIIVYMKNIFSDALLAFRIVAQKN